MDVNHPLIFLLRMQKKGLIPLVLPKLPRKSSPTLYQVYQVTTKSIQRIFFPICGLSGKQKNRCWLLPLNIEFVLFLKLRFSYFLFLQQVLRVFEVTRNQIILWKVTMCKILHSSKIVEQWRNKPSYQGRPRKIGKKSKSKKLVLK